MRLIGNGGVRPLESPESRCRRWQVWQFVDVGGKRQQRTETFVGGKRDARRRLESFRAELADEVPNTETLRSYCDRWLAWAEDFGDYSPRTLVDYGRFLNACCNVMGDMSLESLDLKAVKDGLTALKHGGSPSGRELSGATMGSYYTALSLVLDSAVAEGAMRANPLDGVPRPKVDTEEKEALSPRELDDLWEKARALPVSGRSMALLCAIDTGMRRGELCALRESDAGRVIVVSESKTRAGKGRALPLTDRLAKALSEWREARPESEYMFCEGDGSKMNPDRLGVWAASAMRRMGYEGMTLHRVRHSNLSKMARYMGVHDLQRWAGWSSIKPAMRYVHDDFSQIEAAVRRSQLQVSSRNVANMLQNQGAEEIAAV